MSEARIDEYLAGRRLYGNDFAPAEVKAWYEREREGYASLGASARTEYVYAYHSLNYAHGFRHIPVQQYQRVLGIGSAYGDELTPIAGRAARITILEPSRSLRAQMIDHAPLEYVEPDPLGTLPFPDDTFQLVVALGVLHHIPNVSAVFAEIARCTDSGGWVLLREPTISMGDWRHPRRGLTSDERGIPLRLLREMLSDAGLEVVRETRCMFSLTGRLSRVTGRPAYNSRRIVALDRLLCRVFAWNHVYHATNVMAKLRPTSVFYVLRRLH